MLFSCLFGVIHTGQGYVLYYITKNPGLRIRFYFIAIRKTDEGDDTDLMY